MGDVRERRGAEGGSRTGESAGRAPGRRTLIGPRAVPAVVAGAVVDAALQARVDALLARVNAVRASYAHEDDDRGATPRGQTAPTPISQQVHAEMQAAEDAYHNLPNPLTAAASCDVDAFQELVVALERKYRESPLVSRDTPEIAGAWAEQAGVRYELGAPGTPPFSVFDTWQNAGGFTKFAVPPPATPGGPLVLRVGNPDNSHVDIGGGPSISAGLLFFRCVDGHIEVSDVENTSGGFRPGPLRNDTAIGILTRLGYRIATNARHDNETGNYHGRGAVLGR